MDIKSFPTFLIFIPHVQLLELEGNFCVHLIPSTTSDNDIEDPFSDTEEPTQNAEMLEYLKSGEVSKVTLENPFSVVEEPTSSKKQGGFGS